MVQLVVVTGPPLVWVVTVTHGPLVQTFPQAPQLFGSLVTSTHLPLQSAFPLGHAAQVPPWQAVPLGQTLLQAPQLLLSPVVSMQVGTPFTTQGDWPAGQ